MQLGELGYNRLAKVCPIIEMVCEPFLSSYNPHHENTIDEAIIKVHRQIYFEAVHAEKAHQT